MEHFIDAVRKYPCLWNTAAIEYRDQELKDAAWTEVMKETELSSVKEVKLKWKKLRDSYRDALRRQSVSGARAAIPWKYQAHMSFLQPHMGARRKPEPQPAAGAAAEDSSSESDASAASPPPAPPHKRPRLASYAPDPLDIFFNAMCQASKRLPYATQLKIKRSLFEAVCEAEEALLAEQQTLASLWAARANSSSEDADEKPS